MRNGKIAKMPEWVREKLNERLEKGESGKTILAWMNEEPYPGQKPMPGFDGGPISKQNLSQWRRGGFREWQMRKEITAANSEMGELGRTVEMAPLAENLLLRVMGHYAVLVSPWDGKPDEKFEAEVRILRGLLRDATLMQRAAGQADKLKEEIRRRKREREDLWGGGGLVEAMRETLRKQREERVEAELQRRADAKVEKEPEGVVAPSQSESNQEVGLDSADAAVKDGVMAGAAEVADCPSGTLSGATEILLREDATADKLVTLPGTGAGESGVVAVGQSESHLEAGLDPAEAVVKDEAAAVNSSSGTLSQATGTVPLSGTGVSESGVVAVGQSESNQKAEGNAKAQGTSASLIKAREDAKNDGDLGQEGDEMR